MNIWVWPVVICEQSKEGFCIALESAAAIPALWIWLPTNGNKNEALGLEKGKVARHENMLVEDDLAHRAIAKAAVLELYDEPAGHSRVFEWICDQVEFSPSDIGCRQAEAGTKRRRCNR